MDREQILIDAAEAQQLLENRLIVGFFSHVEQGLFEKFKESHTSEERETIHAQLKNINILKNWLHNFVLNGMYEETNIEGTEVA